MLTHWMLNVPGRGRRERYHIGKTLEEGRGALAKWFYNQGWKIDSRVRSPHPDTPPPKYQVGWHPSGPRSHLGVLGWPVGWMDRYWVTVKNLGPWGMTPIDSGWKSGQGGSLGLGVVGGVGGQRGRFVSWGWVNSSICFRKKDGWGMTWISMINSQNTYMLNLNAWSNPAWGNRSCSTLGKKVSHAP